jgi:hypothetical protein
MFGTDYNRQLYEWLLAKFEPVKDIGPYGRTGTYDRWGVLIYKRKLSLVRGHAAAISPVAAGGYNPDPASADRRSSYCGVRRG